MDARMLDSTNSGEGAKRQRDRHTLRFCGNAIRQQHIPSAFAGVHPHDDGGFAGRMVLGLIHENEIGPQLFNLHGRPIEQQAHFHIGGMAALVGD